jgi:hypothetical protein
MIFHSQQIIRFGARCRTFIPQNLLHPLAGKALAATLFSFAVGSVAHAEFTTIAYEGFDYSAGSLSGKNGGTGWTSAWTNDYLSGGSFVVSETGMSYSGLSVSGGSAVWSSGGNGISQDARTIPLMYSGVVYFQFLGQFGSASGGGTPNIRLLNSGTLTGGFGGNGGTYGHFMSILDTSLQPAADGSSSSSVSLSGLNLVIARIDYENQKTEMWLNPDLSTFSYHLPTAPDATFAGLAPVFDTIALFSRSPGQIDEITIKVEPVPEPGSAALIVTGIMTLIGCRRRFLLA